ncbi:MAG: alanine racemase [Gemmatimonadaceae bacterium]|nr:alanine racemase [Gemmatimonadaceae bacterium]
MSLSRRRFLAAASASPLLASPLLSSPLLASPLQAGEGDDGDMHGARDHAPIVAPARFEPWVEVTPSAMRHNVDVLSRLAGERPIIAVIKNNGYGLGLREVARILELDARVQGFGVVKVSEALALREAGIRKPILLLALFDDTEGEALVRGGVTLSLCVPDAAARVARAAARARRAATAQLYIDTGMSRMGVPYHRALPIMREMAGAPRVTLRGMFTELTEDRAFDTEQVGRLTSLAAEARSAGVTIGGPLHAASSHAVFNHADTLLDAVRPGISLFGGYPTDDGRERSIAALQVALAVRARVVRVERLRPGDSVSYGRRFTAESPTWTATIPVGHADGYPRGAVKGSRILIGDRTYPVIGAVSASHCVVNLGSETTVAVGDVATLIGPDHPDVHPNQVATAAGVSVYDVLMHLGMGMPRIVV